MLLFFGVKCWFCKLVIKKLNESHDDCVGCLFSSSSSNLKVGEDEVFVCLCVCVAEKEGGGFL